MIVAYLPFQVVGQVNEKNLLTGRLVLLHLASEFADNLTPDRTCAELAAAKNRD
jgi:hypothetical protein